MSGDTMGIWLEMALFILGYVIFHTICEPSVVWGVVWGYLFMKIISGLIEDYKKSEVKESGN